MEALNPSGLLLATTIGRAARSIQDKNPIFLEGTGWPKVKLGYDETGYGYVDYDGHKGYGLSLTSPAWITGLATTYSGRRLVMMSECAWDGTQDVFALQADLSFKTDTVAPTHFETENTALRARISALENSTSWKLTSLLRLIYTNIFKSR